MTKESKKDQLKKILDGKGIKYTSKATIAEMEKLIQDQQKSSKPKVEKGKSFDGEY